MTRRGMAAFPYGQHHAAHALLISSILRFGTTLHGDQEVVTWTAEGPRRASYAEVGRQAAQLRTLRGLGSAVTTGWRPSCGTTPSTSPPIWPSVDGAPCSMR